MISESHTTNTTHIREREREREREMIADAFFAFLSWLRLLFFNREMELALIGTTTTTTTTIYFLLRTRVMCLCRFLSSPLNSINWELDSRGGENVSLSLSLEFCVCVCRCRRKVDERVFLSFFLFLSLRSVRLVSVSGWTIGPGVRANDFFLVWDRLRGIFCDSPPISLSLSFSLCLCLSLSLRDVWKPRRITKRGEDIVRERRFRRGFRGRHDPHGWF